MSIRTLIADDDEAVRGSIGDLLGREADIQVIGKAENGRMAVTLARELRPDIAVLDVIMPGTNGIQAAAEITRAPGCARVIGISMHDEPEWVRQMIRAGASGYVLKETAAEELAAAVRAVFTGGNYFGRGIEPVSVPAGEPGDTPKIPVPAEAAEGDSKDPSNTHAHGYQGRDRARKD